MDTTRYLCRVTNKAGHEFMVYAEDEDGLVTFCAVHPGTTVHVGFTMPMYVNDLVGPVREAITTRSNVDMRTYKKPAKVSKKAQRVAEVLNTEDADDLAQELGLL